MPEENGERARKRKGIIQLLKTEYRLGDTVPESAIYECSECESITAFKKGEIFLPCDDCKEPSDEQTWYRTNEFVRFVSKNVNTEFSRIETFSLRVAEFIATVAGNVWFVYFHVVWFGLWVWMNTGHELWGHTNFDPYPFGLLTMVVSLEAIFLSTFILIAQSLQGTKSELRAELDYQTNLKAEKGVAEILSILHDMREAELSAAHGDSELAKKGIVLRRELGKKLDKNRVKHAHILSQAGIDIVHPHKPAKKKSRKA